MQYWVIIGKQSPQRILYINLNVTKNTNVKVPITFFWRYIILLFESNNEQWKKNWETLKGLLY